MRLWSREEAVTIPEPGDDFSGGINVAAILAYAGVERVPAGSTWRAL